MLEPDSRSLLLDALRPPDGYVMDRAVGTTFSLDLHALLTAPLAFAMFDAEASDEDSPPDVVALLEATRRYADRISIFGQAGRIVAPKSSSPVFSNIEGSVHEAVAPNNGGLFHPKVWALRYTSLFGDEPLFRLLVLSRNLTFDQSWDTIVRLDGARAVPKDRPTARTTNEPLVRFLKALPEMAVLPLPDHERQEVISLANDIRDVAFDIPSGFNELYFDTYGAGEHDWTPFDEGHDRALIISPFLGDALLAKATASGGGHVLVSRSESLDALQESTLDAFEKVYVLDSAASGLDSERNEDDLFGLHAKVYILEYRGQSSVVVGSANATSAAFSRNVEFGVELRGRTRNVGIDMFLDSDSDTATMLDLLVRYSPTNDNVAIVEDTDPEGRVLDDLRHKIAAVGFSVIVTDLEDSDDYSVRIRSNGPLPGAAEVTAHCHPMTLGGGHAYEVGLGDHLDVEIPRVSFAALTPFVTFRLTCGEGKSTQSVSFIVNAELVGAPEDRHQRILSSLLDDRGKVLRYLLFLLSDPTTDYQFLGSLIDRHPGVAGNGSEAHLEIPLLEALLRALAHDPSRLDPIDRLLKDLTRTEEGTHNLPPGIEDVWGPIWEARQGRQP